jgi:glutathione gamma-glutamylcysteinyltransferase
MEAGPEGAAAPAALAEVPTFYRRPLPESCVALSSVQGRALFSEALAAGGAEGYFRLAETFTCQSEPASCGLGSLAMVLNALAVDPHRVWKGNWRWFDESLLDCCVPLDVVAREGIDLPSLACLARCNGAEVRVRSLGDSAACSAAPHQPRLCDFETDVRASCFAPADVCLLASYSRSSLGQTVRPAPLWELWS